jgi:hypothetical protein
MRKFIIVAASLAALALPTVALAGTGTQYGSSASGGASGNGTQVTHYSVPYSDPLFGPVSCTGVHQVKQNKAPQDSFTCTSTTGSPLTNSSPGQPVAAPWGWYSDYNGLFTNNLTGTVSADGMSYTAVATY